VTRFRKQFKEELMIAKIPSPYQPHFHEKNTVLIINLYAGTGDVRFIIRQVKCVTFSDLRNKLLN